MFKLIFKYENMEWVGDDDDYDATGKHGHSM
jgi:hypothetical protein